MIKNIKQYRKLIRRIIGWLIIAGIGYLIYSGMPVLLAFANNLVYLILFGIITLTFLYLIYRLIR